MIMDAMEQGWTTYQANSGPISAFMELDYGTRPYGAGLEAWLEFAPSFNLERVRSPLMMWIGQTGSVESLWDWYAGLRRMGKPVEYWVSPGAEHDPVKVAERLRANQLLVDWFAFWLADREIEAHKNADQYQRWRAMREQQQHIEKTPRPPLLDWSSQQRPQ
jgi:hypothetical protein